MEAHRTHYCLIVKNTDIQSSLEVEKKSLKEATTIVVELASHIIEVVKDLQKVKESREKEQEIYEGKMIFMRKKVDDSLWSNPHRDVYFFRTVDQSD